MGRCGVVDEGAGAGAEVMELLPVVGLGVRGEGEVRRASSLLLLRLRDLRRLRGRGLPHRQTDTGGLMWNGETDEWMDGKIYRGISCTTFMRLVLAFFMSED